MTHLHNRVVELLADGYLLRGSQPGTVILTAKGLQVLLACAERPMPQSKLVKETLQHERDSAAASTKGKVNGL